MKKLFTLTTLVLTLVCTTKATAQKFSGLDASPMDVAIYPTDSKIQQKSVKVVYSRPQLKGRSLTTLTPEGQVWRTGANESTEITFYKDADFGGKMIKAGTYSLFTIPGKTEWTVILNKNLNQWGAYSYDEGADVARIKVPNGSDATPLEAFSIAFKEDGKNVQMVMGWDKTRVAVPITFSM